MNERAMTRGRSAMRSLTSLGAMAFGCLGAMAGPACAQEAETEERPRAAGDEIVVTAQFREQNIQDAPLAITAITGDMLDARSQTSIADVAAQAPNVTLRPASGAFGPALQAFIRGIGQSDFSYALEPGVGMYVDDVYYSTLIGSIFDLLDLERVEVLRGPQGTLAGQNSIGGAVKLYSRRPTGEGGGFVQATYGDFDRTEVRAAGEFTLVPDRLFARIAGVAAQSDGYVTRLDYGCAHPGSGVPTFATSSDCELGTEGGKAYAGVRAALRWVPSDNVEVNIVGDYTNDESEAAPLTLLYVGNLAGPGAPGVGNTQINGVPLGTPTGSVFIPYSPLGAEWADDPLAHDPYVSYATYCDHAPVDGTPAYCNPAVYRVDSWGASARVEIDLTDNLSLTSITAYRYYESDWSVDEGTPINAYLLHNSVWHEQTSQEARLNGVLFNGAFDFTLGGFYLDQKSHYGGRISLRTINGFFENDDIPAQTWAAFANTDWHLTDALDLILGVRYTESEKTFNYGRLGIPGSISYPNAPPQVNGLNGASGRFEGERTDYRAVVEYRWSDAFMTYAQFATGFRGGGVNPRPFTPAQALPHEPETVDAYEIGFKSDWFERRVRLNAAAFFNLYEDILFSVTNCPTISAPPCFLPINAGEAEVQGVEIELRMQPIERLTIDGMLSYLDFQYTSISPEAQSALITPNMRAPYAPEWQYSLGVQYEIPLGGNAGSLTPRFDLNHQDEFFTAARNAPPFNVTPERTVLNGRLTWDSPDESWRLALEVTNMTDEIYYNSIRDDRGSSLTVQGMPAPPRRWALTARRNF